VSKYARRGRKRNGSQLQRQVTVNTYNGLTRLKLVRWQWRHSASVPAPQCVVQVGYDAKPAETGGESLGLPSHRLPCLVVLVKRHCYCTTGSARSVLSLQYLYPFCAVLPSGSAGILTCRPRASNVWIVQRIILPLLQKAQ